MRIKRGTIRSKRHKKILKQAKGYQGRKRSVFKLAKQAVIRAKEHSYRHRKTKKREARALWILKINAACRLNGMKYSEFIKKLSDNKIILNRKILADFAENEPKTFEAIVKKVK